MSSYFCHVKFLCDDKKSIVPSSFVKDFDLNYDAKKVYEIFWSPNEEDTPTLIFNKQGKILTVDREKEVKNNITSPLPGYYFGNILRISDSEKDLVSILDSKKGRKQMHSGKFASKISKPKEAIKEGKKRSSEMLARKFRCASELTDSDSDDSVIPNKIHREKISALLKTIKDLKTQNYNLKAEKECLQEKFNQIFKLNIALQTKLVNSDSPLSLSASTTVHCPPLPPPPSVEPVQPSLISSNQVPASVADEVSLHEPVLGDEFKLDERILGRVSLRVKAGSAGDSLFVKNLALAVFGEDTLMSSSVTGTKCNSKKECIAKPALCAKKMEYVKKLFHDRISRETPACSEEEITKRIGKLNTYVAEKIFTLIRKSKV